MSEAKTITAREADVLCRAAAASSLRQHMLAPPCQSHGISTDGCKDCDKMEQAWERLIRRLDPYV